MQPLFTRTCSELIKKRYRSQVGIERRR